MEGFTIRDLMAILRRRFWHLTVPAVLLMLGTVAAVVLLPPLYRSTATVLIEQPEIPKDFVRATVSSLADQRLRAIQQKITASGDLSDLVTRFDLYPAERRTKPMNEVVDKMRDNIKLMEVSPDLSGKPLRPNQTAIGFTLSFDYGDPVLAQRVANELVSRFLSENLKTRREQSSQTAQFLGAETKRVEDRMKTLESEIAVFKNQHAGALPEDLTYNMQLAEKNERDLTELVRQIQIAEQRRTALKGQLAVVSPTTTVDGRGRDLGPAGKLQVAQTELAELSGRYGARHPDVLKKRREVASLQVAARAQPIQAAVRGDANPAYLQIQAQLEGIDAEMRSLTVQRDAVRAQLQAYQAKVQKTPDVERDYLALRRDYDNVAARYNDLKTKATEADMAQAVERDSKSERFTLVEPADLPGAPVKPQRMMLLAIGMVLAAGAGVGTVVGAEALSSAVYDPRQVRGITGALPLVAIPYLSTPSEKRGRWQWRWAWVGLGIAAILGALLAIDRLWMPLDVLTAVLSRSAGLN
ncbi:GumC family protein [Lacibacterium aquatile]|uniref:GumC family protein n=1 Tax=Lacibacterium aquatile TaxID=1168082 RepID=A0ABW5E259_9PROT